ncbi:F-box domain [Macleaya cordata]|uniref:F-box domain n=1 Tax=Macleaya cordata TaxID=56857 RepID=A0A200QVD6_MACCD|nr:F-box domain [Macleaya cordata]
METRNSPFSKHEDRISKLPDTLIHHILSFIDMKYAVQTSVLSRRWRHKWKSLGTLNFDDGLFNSPIVGNSFVDFVDKFPQCLFTCKSLTKLALEMGGKESSKIILPDSMSLPRLKFLKFGSLSIYDEKVTDKLFSSCPALESLILIDTRVTDYDMNLNISSLKLKHIELDNCGYFDTWESGIKTIKLYAPNLTSFSCKDYMSQDYSLENLSSLFSADINMVVEEDYETPEFYSKLPVEVKELYAQHMMKFLRALYNVKDLKLSSGFLEITFSSGNIGDYWEAGLSLPCMLHHLKFVEIREVLGCVNELKLLEILLKNSIVLEKVILFSSTSEQNSRSRERRIMKFSETLITFPRASTSTLILFRF